ncbi:MAG: hypothetical protein CM1200mP26_23100 [Acidimicrobiales bacterium]|nr:MAG: hypothetical protein CM1200mP26_23100 [Acidimicrobiales bacterium]
MEVGDRRGGPHPRELPKRILEGFRDDAHAMGVMVSSIAAMSTFWPDSKNIEDPAQRQGETVRLIAKMPTFWGPAPTAAVKACPTSYLTRTLTTRRTSWP